MCLFNLWEVQRTFLEIKKAPCTTLLQCKGRCVSRFHPNCSMLNIKTQNHSYDDNGITGPDWGHSELVFKCFLSRYSQLRLFIINIISRVSLSGIFHILLVSSLYYPYKNFYVCKYSSLFS